MADTKQDLQDQIEGLGVLLALLMDECGLNSFTATDEEINSVKGHVSIDDDEDGNIILTRSKKAATDE